MSKLYIQNLGLIITENCNLKCKHCMRGESTKKKMSQPVIEALDQLDSIGNVTICGGEPTLALDTLESIMTFIIEHHIPLSNFSTTINGTIYSEEFLRLLDYIDGYIPHDKYGTKTIFGVSKDPFHYQEAKRLGLEDAYLENLIRYQENPHFLNYREIDNKIFREGRAQTLPEDLTVELRPWPIVYTHHKKQDIIEAGPLVTINPDGVVTECDASIENQNTIYNYGNVLDESLEDIIIRVGTETSPLTWYHKTGKIIKKQMTYSK